MNLEICVDSILSAVNASEAGAARVELCSALSEGGLTPSAGLFTGVKKAIGNSKTKIFCMIRIRRGDFSFSDEEIEAMIEDIKYFKKNDADGIVIGSLSRDYEIHVENCRKLISAWGADKPVTFHRAFDETNTNNYRKNIDIIAELGVKRILTSGFTSAAEQGIEMIKELIAYATNRGVTIMPGAGINKDNVFKIIEGTGCKEIHASARSQMKTAVPSRLSMGGGSEDLQPLMICDPEKVRELLQLLNQT